MKIKKAFWLLLFLVSFLSFSQEKDSIITFFDRKGKVVKSKENARSFKILTKKNDTLWLVKSYRKNGTLSSYTHSKSRENKNKIGEEVLFHLNRKKRGVNFYDSKGRKQGKSLSWFPSGNVNHEGIFIKNKKEGVWRFYHPNKQLAARGVFKNDILLSSKFYDKKGNVINYKITSQKIIRPSYKGGKEKLVKDFKTFFKRTKYRIKGKVFVNFLVTPNGDVEEVTIDEKLPKELEKEVVQYFKSMKGWQSAKHLNREIPYYISLPLKFQG